MDHYLSILSGPIPIERTELYTYLIQNYVRNEAFQLWRSVLKPILLDEHIMQIELRLLNIKHCISHIRCRRCCSRMKWTDFGQIEAGEIYFLCPNCPYSKPLLKCHIKETVAFLVDLINRNNPQIIASAVKSILISGHVLNSVSPPAIPDNPFKVFKTIYETSPNILKFGGGPSVIMADLYECNDIKEFPILYISDTVSIPTRYFLYALKYKSEFYNPRNGQSEEHTPDVLIPKYQEDFLIKELILIANAYLRAESCLVLGPKLQNYISKERYSCRDNHNLSIIVPLSSLCPLDKNRKHHFPVTENFEEITSPAVRMCKVVQSVVKNELQRFDSEGAYEYLQEHLNVTIWLTAFQGTPFETLIYHMIR